MRIRFTLVGIVVLTLMLRTPQSVGSTPAEAAELSTPLLTFGPGADIGAVAAPIYAIAEGDLDHDGDPDLVTGLASGAIVMWINEGSPFGALWTSADVGNCGDAVYALALGDLDHDGNPDLVSGCGGGAPFEVVAWRNDGTPFDTLWAHNDLGGADPIRSLAVGDLDNDGWLDVVSGAVTGVISGWWNDTTPFSGLWGTHPILGTTVDSADALALGDLDHDGDLDLVSGDANRFIKVWRNDGPPLTGSWFANTAGESKAAVHTLRLGDLDADGTLEIVSDVEYPNSGDTGIAVWRGDATPFDGTWPLTVIGSTTDVVNCLGVADLDRDGALDIVSGDQSGTVMALENPASPFGDPWVEEKVGTSTDSVLVLTMNDLEGDGDPDIVSCSDLAEDFEIIAWENTDPPDAFGAWIEVTQPLPAYDAHAVDVTDFDHDGKRDVVAGTDAKELLVWRGDGGYTWERVGESDLPYGIVHMDVAWGQLNNRHEVDLAVANKGLGLSAWVAWEDGTVWDDRSDGLPITGDFEAVALGHIDHDGKMDLAAAGMGTGIQAWRGNGVTTSPYWDAKTVVSDTLDFCDVALGDMDHNGALDLVGANCGNDAGILFWPGNGTFGYVKVYPVVAKGTYVSLALGDIDGDGTLDVAAALDGGGVGIFLGDGAGSWSDKGVVSPTLTVLGVDLGDFNGDGHLDLLAGHKGGVQVWQGDGGGSWADASVDLPTAGTFSGVVFGRIDGDAALDIAAAEFGASGARIWTAVEPPPGGWANFEPSTGWWIRDQTPTCTVEVADAGSGLDVSTAQYRFSVDGGSTWGAGWLPAAITGADGTTDPQVMTATDVAFSQDSIDRNVVQFRVTDLAGHTGTSPLYTVMIDATPPANPTALSSTSHTPGVWSAASGVNATWSGATDATSGVWAYSHALTTSPTGMPDEVVDTYGTSDIRYATADGQNWYFHVRTEDRAGNWSPTAAHSGPYWIDITDPGEPPGLASSSHNTNVWNDDSTISVSWDAATDGAGSDIAGYWYSWTHAPQDDPTAYNTLGRSLTSPSLATDNDWTFNVQTRDNVGRRSDTLHLGPFYIDTIAPYADVNPPYPTSASASFTVSWSSWESSSPQSGVTSVDIWYRDVTGDGMWREWLSGQAPIDSDTFHGTDGHTYDFRARATDLAGNVGPWCTTATTVVASLDIEAFALEVNQSVQDLNNSVVLVSNKRTYVRLHVRSLAHGDQGPLGAQLSAWRDGIYLGTIPPNNAGGTITVRTGPDRGLLNDSFYFDIPTTWLNGTVEFTGEVNTDHTLAEYDYANNDFGETVTFHGTPTMDVKLVDACYKTGGTTYHVRDIDRIYLADYLRRAYPISRLAVRWAVRLPCYTYRPEAWEVNCSLDWDHWWAWVFSDEGWYARWYGMVDDGGGFTRGLGQRPGNVATGPSGSDDWGWDYDGSYADWYGAHELGHTYNRRHTACSGEADAVVVYPGGDISPTRDPNAPNALYGLDVGTLTLYPPGTKDIMTYCGPLWLSDVTYEGIRGRMVDESGLSAAAAVAEVGEHLVVFGAVISPTDQITLTTFYRMRDSWDAFGRVPGEYSIRLLSASGSTLADYAFTPSFEWLDSAGSCPASGGVCPEGAEATDAMIGTISEAVPWVAGTARIAIFHGTQEIGSRPASAHEPEVTLVAPNGGESFTGATIPVSWTASDDDYDALEFTLGYSTDGGSTWGILANGLTGSSLVLDASLVEGTAQGKFRIVASDGVNTAQDDTDGVFGVPNKGPDVTIMSPSPLAAYTFGQVIALVVDARDLEGGTLEGSSLTWTSSLSGTLGIGAMLHVTDLITGTHTITVTADDGMGGTAAASVKIFIGTAPGRTYLPLVLKLH